MSGPGAKVIESLANSVETAPVKKAAPSKAVAKKAAPMLEMVEQKMIPEPVATVLAVRVQGSGLVSIAEGVNIAMSQTSSAAALTPLVET